MSLARTSRLLVIPRFSAGSVVRNTYCARFKSDTSGTPEGNVPPAKAALTQKTTQGPAVVPNVAATRREAEVGVPLDYGTNAYSPVTVTPEHRGPNDPVAANVISGAPPELQARTVRIYKPAKNATQSGHWNGRQWKMDWDVLTRGHRWENPLMGWQSSGDVMQGTHMFFNSKEDAIGFAEKQGYDWFVQEPNTREFRVKSYAANFVHSPTKLKIVRTK